MGNLKFYATQFLIHGVLIGALAFVGYHLSYRYHYAQATQMIRAAELEGRLRAIENRDH